MSFQRYPEYKDSGVEWLGEVPAHWVVGPLRWYATIQGGVAKGKSYSDDTPTVDLPYLRVANVQDGYVDLSSVNTLAVALSEVDRYRLQTDDVLMNEGGDNDKLGRGTVWEGEIADCLHQNHVFAIRPNQYLLPYWLSMFTRSNAARSYFYLYSKQSTNLASISSSNVMSCPLPLPPQEEQRQVLSFLDHETARIDALVGEQQRLIELLKEKRQAVISHAVTKGLDPDVPMKNSGVEWLGEVPAHWEVRKASYIGRLFGSDNVPEDMVSGEGDVPYLKVGSLSTDSLEVASWGWYVDPTISRSYRACGHYVVFPKRGAAIFLNKVNVVSRPALIDPNLMGWEIEGRYSTWYFAYALKLRKLDELADVSTVPQINNKHIGPERFPVPPIEEQNEIVSYLKKSLGGIDELVATSEAGMKLLQERRSALISAAVTGKIDVRGWQPPTGSSD